MKGHLLALALAVTSWYGAAYQGRPMANGHPFDRHALTCASWDYPLGTRLKVASRASGMAVIVVVTDRGPAKRLLATRQLDLSEAAFKAIAPLKQGLAEVAITVLPPF